MLISFEVRPCASAFTQLKVMKKLHLAIATHNLVASVRDYTARLGCEPCVVVENQYALWRTETVNMSVRLDVLCKPGELRHLGWEDAQAVEFTSTEDVNNIVWEHFSAPQQAQEIEQEWPGTGYVPSSRFE